MVLIFFTGNNKRATKTVPEHMHIDGLNANESYINPINVNFSINP